MKYLVAANVLSEATKPRPSAAALDWLARHESVVAVTPIILGELQYGIRLLPNGKQRQRLLDWFASGVKHLPVLDLDSRTAQVWAELLAGLRRKGQSMSVTDSLIAASARQHHLGIATRNVHDFRHAGVTLVNPFA